MKVPERAVEAAYAAIEQANERVVITDRGGTILYVNPAFERVTGYDSSEVVGQTPRILKSGQHSREFYQELWTMLLSGHAFRARFVNKKRTANCIMRNKRLRLSGIKTARSLLSSQRLRMSPGRYRMKRHVSLPRKAFGIFNKRHGRAEAESWN